MLQDIKKTLILIDTKLKKQLLTIFFISVIGTFLEALGIGVILPILKIIVEGEDFLKNYHSNFETINQFLNYMSLKTYKELITFLLFFVIFIFLIKTLFFLYLINKQTKLSHSIEYKLAKTFFYHYLNQDYSFHLMKNSSKLFSNITEEIKNFRLNLVDPFLVISTEIIFIFVIAALLILIEPLATTITAIFIIVIAFFYINFTKSKISYVALKRQKHEALKIQHLKQGLNGIKEIKISGKENVFLDIFDKHNQETVDSRAKLALWTSIPRYLLEFLSVAGISVLAILFVRNGGDLKSLLPTLGVFLVATFRLLPSTVKIVQSYGKIRFGLPSSNLLRNELDQSKIKPQIKKDFQNNIINNFNKLSFKNISFQYPNSNKNILDNISLNINKGDKIGIVGPSGSGKSTFIDLLTGLISPSKGEVYLNEKLVNLKSKNWFKKISYTPQFIFLSDDTILNNIAFGVKKEDLNIENVKKASELSELKNYIVNLNQGLNTFIGEFGIRLSGGQKQRIGIARSLYTNSEILILDESTSAIDLHTEEKIINNINTLSEKTIIIVSHRLSTLKNCNKIIEIKNGHLEFKKI